MGEFSTHAFKSTCMGLDTFLPSPGLTTFITSFHCRDIWSTGTEVETCAGCRIVFRGTCCDVISAFTIRTQYFIGGTNSNNSTGIVLGWILPSGHIATASWIPNPVSPHAIIPINNPNEKPVFIFMIPSRLKMKSWENIPKPVKWNV